MDWINNEWGLPMAGLALVLVLAIFGLSLWFILSAMETNKKYRWFQIVRRPGRPPSERSAQPNVRRSGK